MIRMRRAIIGSLLLAGACAEQPAAPAAIDEQVAARIVSGRADGVLLRNPSKVRRYYALGTTEMFTIFDWAACVREPWCQSIAAGDSVLVKDQPDWTRGTSMDAYFWSATRDGSRVDDDSWTLVRFRR
jgi:hypothetical protein